MEIAHFLTSVNLAAHLFATLYELLAAYGEQNLRLRAFGCKDKCQRLIHRIGLRRPRNRRRCVHFAVNRQHVSGGIPAFLV